MEVAKLAEAERAWQQRQQDQAAQQRQAQQSALRKRTQATASTAWAGGSASACFFRCRVSVVGGVAVVALVRPDTSVGFFFRFLVSVKKKKKKA